MDQKYFGGIPFALSGDRDAVPLTAVDGFVSYTTGFGEDYSRELGVDPLAKPIRRLDWNGIMYDVTEAIGALQLFGYAEWVSAADNGGIPVQYGENATVIYRADPGDPFLVYRSLEAANTAIPTDDTKWQDVTLPVTLARLAMSDGANLSGYGTTTVKTALDRQIAHMKSAKDFGVIGDGVANDTAAMALVGAYNGQVSAVGMTILHDNFTVTGSLKLYGGTLKMRSAAQRIRIEGDGVEFHGVTFDANGLKVATQLVRIPSTATGWVFNGCTFQNIIGTGGVADPDKNQYAIYADLDGAIGRITNCTFMDISNVAAAAPVSGFCGAMLLSAVSTGAIDVRIDGVTMRNIFSTNIAGNINNSDADGIRLFGPQPTVKSNLQMTRITAIDVQKSAIKVSGTSGIIVDTVSVYNDRSDIGMIAGVRFQAADNSIIKNISLFGRMSVGVNIRSANILVDGVTYSPIDSARDVMSGGLVQLQSDDTYVTEHVKVCNVIGRNIGQVFDFDLTGVAVSTAFRFISFHNWDITGLAVASAGTASRVQSAAHLLLDNVQIWDPSSAWLNCINFTNTQNFKAHGCRFECRRDMFSWTSGALGCSGIEFDFCSFFRPDTASPDNFGMVIIREAGGGALDRVAVRNCTISCPTYTAVGNQHALRYYATNGVIEGVSIFVRGVGGNVSPPTGWVSASVLACKLSDVKVSANVVLTNGSGGYAIDLTSSSVSNVVTDTHCSSGPGLRAPSGANNNMFDSIAGKVAAVSNSGTGNTVGTTHIIP